MGQVFGGVMCPLLLLRAGPFLSHELAPVGELAIYVWPRGHAKRLHLHLKGVDWHSDDTSPPQKKDIKLQLATPALRAKLFDGNNPKREVIDQCLWCFPSQPIKSWMGSNSVLDLAGGHKQCWILAMTEFLAARKKAVTNQWQQLPKKAWPESHREQFVEFNVLRGNTDDTALFWKYFFFILDRQTDRQTTLCHTTIQMQNKVVTDLPNPIRRAIIPQGASTNFLQKLQKVNHFEAHGVQSEHGRVFKMSSRVAVLTFASLSWLGGTDSPSSSLRAEQEEEESCLIYHPQVWDRGCTMSATGGGGN